MPTLVNLEQGSPEWLEFRRTKITGTDAGKILQAAKLPRWNPYDLWIDKIMGRNAPINDAMRLGIELEPFARSLYEKTYECSVSAAVAVSDNNDFMMASLDGLSKDKKKAVEFKCSKKTFEMAKDGKIPDYYIPQLQHTLSVLELNEMDYCSYFNSQMIKISVYRDEKYIEKLVEKEKEFYDCLINMKEPSVEGSFEIEDSDYAISLFTRLEIVEKEIKNLECQKKSLRDELISIADNRNIIIGKRMKIRKVVRKGNIDYSSVPEIQGIDLEKYRKPSCDFYTFSY